MTNAARIMHGAVYATEVGETLRCDNSSVRDIGLLWITWNVFAGYGSQVVGIQFFPDLPPCGSCLHSSNVQLVGEFHEQTGISLKGL